MKNQYFGDNRDLFKFDLAQTLTEKSQQQLNQIYYIPMLTPNTTKPDGRQTDRCRAKAGHKNVKLVEYLDNCISTGRRNIKEIKQYYHEENVKISIYQEDEYFTHAGRPAYFSQINQSLLNNSLILLDPDNGMEVKSSDEKHILYTEIEMLYNHMNENSVLMIFQYFPRIEHNKYTIQRKEDIKRCVGKDVNVYSIADDVIVFFLIAKTPAIAENVKNTVTAYQKLSPELIISI